MTNRGKRILAVVAALTLSLTAVFMLCGCFPTNASVKLTVPTDVAINGDVLSWNFVSNAASFDVKIDDRSPITGIKALSYTLKLTDAATYSISVRAAGDKRNYTASDWSNPLEYTIHPIQLSEPIGLLLDDDHLTWEEVENADEYEVKINNSSPISVGESTEYTLEIDKVGYYSIQVRACSSNSNFSTSEWSSAVTYVFGSGSAGLEFTLIEGLLGEEDYYEVSVGRATEGGVTELVIPAWHDGKRVTTIASQGFYDDYEGNNNARTNEVTSIIIGEGIEVIGEDAFRRCLQLSTISLPDTLLSIHDNAFLSCQMLDNVELNQALESIGVGAFCDTVALTSIAIPAGVRTISAYAFYNSGIESVSLPKTVLNIGTHAFATCVNLNSIVLDKATLFSADSFDNTSLTIFTSMTEGIGEEELTTQTIVWGVKLGYFGDNDQYPYVLSFEKTTDSITTASGDLNDPPVRAGYVFDGWTTEIDGAKEYESSQLFAIEDDTTLYAVWTKFPPDPEDPDPEDSEPEDPEPEDPEPETP